MRRQHSLRLWSVLVALAVLVVLLQLCEARKVLFERSKVPHGWLALRRAPASSPVRFTVGLRGATVDDMANLFWAVSDPTSEQYLQLLTREQVEQRFGPSAEQRSLVQQWLAEGGVEEAEIKHVSSAIEVRTRAEVAERLFATEMRVFQHASSGKQVAKAWGSAELPSHIHPAVELVTGLSAFPVPRTSLVHTDAAADYVAVIPQTIRSLYQIRPQQSGSSNATQGVIEFGGEYFSNQDTAAFAAIVGYTSGNATIQPITDEHIVGDNDPSAPGVESTLDVQMLASTNLEAVTWFWVEDFSSWLYEYALHSLNATTVPQVVSISYGLWEGMQCFADAIECELLDIDSDEYTAATNGLFMKMGLSGTAIVVASGDSGANSRTDELCAASNLRPEFPASSPYVTTVGATMIINATYGFSSVPACGQGRFQCIESGVEVAVSRSMAGFTAGGGFSNTSGATRPRYQDSVVTAYLQSGVTLPPDSYYNVKGRAEPDVAAVGSLGLISLGGQYGTVGGTSMSAPIFAGVASLLNELAVSKTGSPLGFLNPLLYKMYADDASTFHDITVGDNICPEEYCGPNCKGYVATTGWDPVTGLGTPNAGKMEAYVSQLLDDVLAKRAARAAANAAASAQPTETIPEEEAATPILDPRLYKQPTPKPSPVTIDSLLLSLNNSRARWTQAKQQRSALNALGAQPDEVWQGLLPLAIAFVGNDTIAVGLPTSIVSLSYPALTITSNCSIDPALTFSGMVASGSSLSVLLIDYLYGGVYIKGLELSTCAYTYSDSIKYPTTLLAVDNDGGLVLTSAGGQEVVWFDTKSGERADFIANTTWTAVTAGAINSVASTVWAAWVVVAGRSLTSGVAVYYKEQLSFEVPITGSYAAAVVLDVLVDSAGQYAYFLYEGITEMNTLELGVQLVDATSGKVLGQWIIPNELAPSTLITISGRPAEVYYMSDNLLVVLNKNGATSTAVGQYPYIPFVSDVAVAADGTVLVASVIDDQIFALNPTGQLVLSYPQIPTPQTCTLIPLLDIAVDYEGNAYQPICNGTIFVFDTAGNTVALVNTGSGSIPRSVAPGPGGTIFFTDDNNKQQVTQIKRDGSVVRTFSTTGTGWLFSVKFIWSAQSIAVTDLLKGQVLIWGVNSTDDPEVLDVNEAIGEAVEVYSLAVDRAHQQAVVSVIAQDSSSLLWFDNDGDLTGKNYTFVQSFATGVAVTYDGTRVYANDLFNSAIYVFHQDDQRSKKVEPVVSKPVAAEPVVTKPAATKPAAHTATD